MARFVHSASLLVFSRKGLQIVGDYIIMNHFLRLGFGWLRKATVLAVFSLGLRSEISTAFAEETFDVLQIGTHTYRNVTVTTKAKNYVFLMHSTGMNNVKVADLPPEVREKLGYSGGTADKGSAKSTTTVSGTGKAFLAGITLPRLKDVQQAWRTHAPASLARLNLTQNLLLALGGVLLFLYVLGCYCGMLICQKAGQDPGALIWIPLLQLIPLLRAAGMSPGWMVAFLVPLLNIIGHVLWSFNIAKARGKSPLVGLGLVLPVTSIFAYLYLAFSQAAPKKQERVVEIMTLEAA